MNRSHTAHFQVFMFKCDLQPGNKKQRKSAASSYIFFRLAILGGVQQMLVPRRFGCPSAAMLERLGGALGRSWEFLAPPGGFFHQKKHAFSFKWWPFFWPLKSACRVADFSTPRWKSLSFLNNCHSRAECLGPFLVPFSGPRFS